MAVMKKLSSALALCSIVALPGCGPKLPPRIESPPPEYEEPEGYEDAGAGDVEEAE